MHTEGDGFGDETALQHASKAGGKTWSHMVHVALVVSDGKKMEGLQIDDGEHLCLLAAFAIVSDEDTFESFFQ